jgi:hypothetical protein
MYLSSIVVGLKIRDIIQATKNISNSIIIPQPPNNIAGGKKEHVNRNKPIVIPQNHQG